MNYRDVESTATGFQKTTEGGSLFHHIVVRQFLEKKSNDLSANPTKRSEPQIDTEVHR